MSRFSRAVTAVVGVAASLAFFAPVAQADDLGTQHYSCGQTRPPNLDGSDIVTATGFESLLRGTSLSCGINGSIYGGEKLDYYCWSRGNDGHSYTYLSAFEEGIAGWVRDPWLPNAGSAVHCPI